MTDAINNPVFTYRIGSLSATIWQNETEKGKYYRTEIARNYRDKDGNWHTSNQFSHDELLNVAKLAERAEAFLASQTQS